MKKLYFIAIAAILSLNSFSQAILPGFYNFENFTAVDSLPDGWTSNISGTYTYANGQVGKAGRLDNTGEYILIETAQAIDTVKYYIKGFTGGAVGTVWDGVFKVQESADTSTWYDLVSDTTLTNTFVLRSLTPAAESRFIRFYFDTKVSGSNVGLDEITLKSSTVLNTSSIKNEELTVFPNPVLGNQVNIRSNKKIDSVQLSNLLGQVVYTNNNPEMNDMITSIHVDKFPKGIYYLNIVNQDQTSTIKKISIR